MPRKRTTQSVDVAIIEENASCAEIATFAKTLNTLLEKRKMHQSELEKETGIASGTISCYRNGKQAPGLVNLIKIANCLDVDCHYLMTGVRAGYALSAKRLGLSDAALSALKGISKGDNATLNAVLESPHFRKLIEYISKSARYATKRGNLIATNIMLRLKGEESPVPAEDMDNLFKFGATDSAGKLFDEVSTDLYNGEVK